MATMRIEAQLEMDEYDASQSQGVIYDLLHRVLGSYTDQPETVQVSVDVREDPAQGRLFR